MKLLVIIFSLLSERFLTHKIAEQRFIWFHSFIDTIEHWLPQKRFFLSNLLTYLIILFPFLLGGYLIKHLLGHGIISFLLNLVIFYYCLGPENPFYPLINEDEPEKATTDYLVKVNTELFALIFWYLIMGLFGILIYRITTLLTKEQQPVSELAKKASEWLNWIPARMTAFLYLIVGDFQNGFVVLKNKLWSSPSQNDAILVEVGIAAMAVNEDKIASLSDAEHLVERAILVYLLFIILFKLLIWL